MKTMTPEEYSAMKRKESKHRYYIRHREEILEKQKAYYREHRDQRKEYMRKYRGQAEPKE